MPLGFKSLIWVTKFHTRSNNRKRSFFKEDCAPWISLDIQLVQVPTDGSTRVTLGFFSVGPKKRLKVHSFCVLNLRHCCELWPIYLERGQKNCASCSSEWEGWGGELLQRRVLRHFAECCGSLGRRKVIKGGIRVFWAQGSGLQKCAIDRLRSTGRDKV